MVLIIGFLPYFFTCIKTKLSTLFFHTLVLLNSNKKTGISHVLFTQILKCKTKISYKIQYLMHILI